MNVFLLKYKSYRSWFILFSCCVLFSIHCAGQIAATEPDSIRQTLLFRSHIFLNKNQITSEILDSLKKDQVPLAIFVDDRLSKNNEELIRILDHSGMSCVFVADRGAKSGPTNSAKQWTIDFAELEKYGSSSPSTYFWIESLTDSLGKLQAVLPIWEHTGRMPVFISTADNRILQTARLVRQINHYPKIFGVVRTGNKLLDHVLWKDFPERNTSGYFSFPIDDSKNQAFAPYKPGYRFSPDIIIPSPENVLHLKVFNALPLEREFGLTDQYLFRGKVKNTSRKSDEEITTYGIRFVSDKQKGVCAWFAGRAYLDGGLKSRLALKPNFTVTAWIKPTELGNNNCIVGKGKNFVLKIRGGHLTFTVQGVKDYVSLKTQIEVNQWSFVSLVHSGAENLVRFYLNGQLTDQVNLLEPYISSDYTVLIGSNLWEEFFKGYISEVKIWERELNDEEILAEFQSGNSTDRSVRTVWFASGVLLLSMAMGLVWIRRWRKKKKTPGWLSNSDILIDQAIAQSSDETVEQITCFGGLKVIGVDGHDICRKFSPKIRQLFVLILLHSMGERKGISSKELSEHLWPGMGLQNAKNTRGTNIQNLKAILASGSGIKLVFQDKLWFFEFPENYFIDYVFVENWLKETRQASFDNLIVKLPVLLSVLKKGNLLSNVTESWLDPFINQMAAQIVEYGEYLFRVLPEGKCDLLLLEISEVISINDPLNEPALRKRISVLTRQGKLGLAHQVYETFGKLYFELYSEKYPTDFKSMVTVEAEI